jgi:hypothetical protein
MQLEVFFIKIFHRVKGYLLESGFLKPSPTQRELSQQLRQKAASLDSPDTTNLVEPAWAKYRIAMRANLLQKDARNFLNWPTICSAMFHEPDRIELEYLKSLPQWERLRKVLKETSVGNPPGYPGFLSSSGNYIHNTYILTKFCGFFNFDISKARKVVEFGGGYGSMCRLVYNLGFSGNYAIFDLPEFCLLQEYFLKSWNKNIKVSLRPISQNQPGVALLSQQEDLQKQLENFNGCPDVFIATWSISESPVELREKVFEVVGQSKYIFIAFHDVFAKVDNVDYFRQFTQLHNNYDWKQEEIGHLPGNFLLAGKRKEI